MCGCVVDVHNSNGVGPMDAHIIITRPAQYIALLKTNSYSHMTSQIFDMFILNVIEQRIRFDISQVMGQLVGEETIAAVSLLCFQEVTILHQYL